MTGNFTAITNTAGDISLTGIVNASGGGGAVTLTPFGNINLNYGLAALITTAAGNILLQRPVVLQANASMSTTGGNVNFTSTVDGAFDLTLAAAAGTVNFGAAVGGTALTSLTIVSASLVTNVGGATINVGGAGAISITTDDIAVGASITTASGPITIAPVTLAQAIRLNDAAGGLNITAVELALLSTSGTVTIGRAGLGTGTIFIGNAGPLPLGGTGWAGLSLVGASSPVTFNLAGANTLTLPNNAAFNTTIGTGAISNPGGAAADVTIPGAAATVTFTSATSVNMTASAARLGASTVTNAITYTTTAGMAVVGAVASTLSNVALNAGVGVGGAFSNTGAGTITAAFAVTITANTIALAGTVTGPFGITLRPDANATTVALNDGAGTFSLTAGELGLLSSTAAVVIGLGTSTAAINIGGGGNINLAAETWTELRLVGASSAVLFNFAGAQTLTLPANSLFRTLIGTGAITNPGLATADVTIGGATSTISLLTAGAVTMTANVAQLSNSTTSGALSFTDTAPLVVIGNVSSSNNPIIVIRGAGLTLNAGITINSGTAVMTIDGGGGPINLNTGTPDHWKMSGWSTIPRWRRVRAGRRKNKAQSLPASGSCWPKTPPITSASSP